MTSLSINGQSYDVDVEPDTPLLWVLRDTIGLTGTRYGCGIAQCGACTVHIDDAPVRSCSMPIASITAGAKITTIEGLAQNGTLHPVQQAWIDHDVPQCGYCQSGMIMAVVALLKDRPKPTDADIAISAAAAPTSASEPLSTLRPALERDGGCHDSHRTSRSALIPGQHCCRWWRLGTWI